MNNLKWTLAGILLATFINTLATVILTKNVYARFEGINVAFKMMDDKVNKIRDDK